MKKILFGLAALPFFASAANAALPIGGYVGLRGGVSVPFSNDKNYEFDMDGNTAPFIGVNGGVRLLSLRGELEYLYRHKVMDVDLKNSSSSEQDVSTSSIMANLYYNALELPFFRLYVNGGVGYTYLDTNVDSNNGSFSWSAGLGVSFTLAETFSLDVGYRYFDMGDIKVNGKSESINSNDIYVGLRFGF